MRQIIPIALAALALTGCSTLPSSLRSEIAQENDKLEQARRDVARAETTMKDDLAKAPALFAGTSVATEWPARIGAAKQKLDRAEAAKKSIEAGVKEGRRAITAIERSLAEQRQLRQAAVDESASVVGEANRWVDFQQNLPQHLAKMAEAHKKLQTTDLDSVAQLVDRAERDWPAKKPDLDSRLNALRSAPERAETQWQSTAAARDAALAGKVAGPQIAALIAADNAISEAATGTATRTAEIKALTGQLYDSWDKILEDLEETESGNDRIYREKIKTVRTRFVDVPLKKTEISSDTSWVDVPASAYRAVEKDLGMAIAHKEAGQYDSEATTVAQPAGYAFMAPPGQSNHYGYWSAGPSGSSMWTWLPQFLIMQQLLGGRNYQPMYASDFHGYQAARRQGKSWYGTDTPQAAPKYGTHGTFTKQNYASSRYVQSGGFRNSGSSASRPGSGASTSAPRQFGRTDNSPEAGRRFGAPGNSTRRASPSSPPSGRRFGGSSGGSRRSFGGRRR